MTRTKIQLGDRFLVIDAKCSEQSWLIAMALGAERMWDLYDNQRLVYANDYGILEKLS